MRRETTKFAASGLAAVFYVLAGGNGESGISDALPASDHTLWAAVTIFCGTWLILTMIRALLDAEEGAKQR